MKSIGTQKDASVFLKHHLYILFSNISLFLLPIICAIALIDATPKPNNLEGIRELLMKVFSIVLCVYLSGIPFVGIFSAKCFDASFPRYSGIFGVFMRIYVVVAAIYSILCFQLLLFIRSFSSGDFGQGDRLVSIST